MVESTEGTQVGDDEFEVGGVESVALATMQIALMQADLAATRVARDAAAKRGVRDEAVGQLRGRLGQVESGRGDPSFVAELVALLEDEGPEVAAARVAEHATQAPRRAVSRKHSLLMLIDLVLFDPWPGKLHWHAQTRRESLQAFATRFPEADETDLAAMLAEHKALVRRLRRRNIRWGRVAVAGAVGLGVGVATAGWAAPLIGTAIGTAAGLSGAAATSAGLATLGGGSLAAGGFGVAGGTALVTGLGGIATAGVAATGARWTPWTAGQIVAGAMRLDLINRVVLAEEANKDEMRRRVVLALQQRLDEVVADRARLIARIRQLNADKAKLSAENRRLRDELQERSEQAEISAGALELVLSRVPEAAAG
ncbi:hypothetical protein [Nocardia brasiliensis]|uniref:hypothetical protein n=1 Tax=Nocardia brasiliensis TaxID=37326 RepID=UPI002455F30E|nr:hypothetical protein [Nocardia brasiliensis]